MTCLHCENYKGGVNNLWVARDSETKLVATSTVSKETAIILLDHKVTAVKLGGKTK